MPKKQKGFTLIELLVILSFIGIFTAMTINFSLNNKDRWSLRDDAREITSLYYQAKQRAARENAFMRIEVKANEYNYYRDHSDDNSGDWQVPLKHEILTKNIKATKTVDFLINPMGFILTNTMPPLIAGAQTITLEAPRGAGFIDQITITIYPYGGLNVTKKFTKKII